MRFFGQSPDYWLDTCTIDAWTNVWGRELRETPPMEEWAAIEHKHSTDDSGGNNSGAEEEGEWQCPLPDETD